jgi:hypothetical protein
MKHRIKKIIRKLAKRFSHTIQFDGNQMKLSDNRNEIVISSLRNNRIVVKYNVLEGFNEVAVIESDLFGVLIDLLQRNTIDMDLRFHRTFNANLFRQSEGQEVSDVLKKISTKLDKSKDVHFTYGGNMYEIEYYDGLVLIMGILEPFGHTVLELEIK